MASPDWFCVHSGSAFDRRNLLLSRIPSLVYQEKSLPRRLQVAAQAPFHLSSGCQGSLLHPCPARGRGSDCGQVELCHPIRGTLHHSSQPPCNSCVVYRHDCSANVRYQHHCLLLLEYLRPSRCFSQNFADCFLWLWTGQFRFRLACHLDN